VLTAATSVSEVIVLFLKPVVFANTDAFFFSLLGLVSHCFLRKLARDGVASRRSITHAILGLF